jgi:hypothetical protein
MSDYTPFGFTYGYTQTNSQSLSGYNDGAILRGATITGKLSDPPAHVRAESTSSGIRKGNPWS